MKVRIIEIEGSSDEIAQVLGDVSELVSSPIVEAEPKRVQVFKDRQTCPKCNSHYASKVHKAQCLRGKSWAEKNGVHAAKESDDSLELLTVSLKDENVEVHIDGTAAVKILGSKHEHTYKLPAGLAPGEPHYASCGCGRKRPIAFAS